MNRILLFCACCAFCALWGCRTVPEASPEAIALSASTSEHSKTDALTAGDEVAVWARLDGTEQYFLEAAKYTVGSDGRSLSSGTPVYYPERKQAVAFFAYFPYHTGVFSVPTDQSTVSALKQADLCWATASSTPVATPVPLEFTHKMARLIITTNNLTSKIVAPNVFSGGTLDINTGTFLNTAKSDVSTTGNELILPAQPVTRLILTVSGIEYVYEGSIALATGQTTSLHLTLHPHTKTATLNGASTTPWTAATKTGETNTPINNQLKLHWVAPHAAYASATKVTLTLENPVTRATQEVDVVPTVVAAESSTAACAYSLPVSLAAGTGLWYPYTITNAKIYQGSTLLYDGVPEVMKGTTIYRSGVQTLAVNSKIFVRDAATNTNDITQWSNVPGASSSLQVKVVTVGVDQWTAAVTGTGLSVSPTSGTSGQIATISWQRLSIYAPVRSGTVEFSTAPARDKITITTNQLKPAPPWNAIVINGVYMAYGNLVAVGPNSCGVGSVTDNGLYFQFGSLVGWAGGANGNGTGGRSNQPCVVKVKPATMTATPTWRNRNAENITTLTDYYFN